MANELELNPEIKTKIQPSSEERKRRKKSAKELSNAFGKAIGGGGLPSMGQMPNSKAPDALGMASKAATILAALSDKKLKKNIKTISNSMEILYG